MSRWVPPIVAVAAVVVAGLPGPVAASARAEALPGTSSGPRAVELLGNRLDDAARLNGLTPTRLRTILLEDRTSFVDARGRLGFVEPAVPAGSEPPPEPAGAAPYALSQTFTLHSRPGAQRTIHLDFNGGSLAGTAWEASWGSRAWWPGNDTFTGYDADGNPATFSDAEKEDVQTIWQEVAEDFAPFDVDVTTETPSAAAITRSSLDDQQYGTVALISTDPLLNDNSSGSGVAYIGVFDAIGSQHSYYQPALVFTDGVAGVPHWIAQTTSHEVGHNLGLDHDGGGGDGDYHYGVDGGLWAPIMGASFSNPVSQWSKGEYGLANNTEDDFAVMTDHGVSLRADEAGQTTATAAAPPTGTAYITSAADQDWYAVSCTAGATLGATVTVAPRGANLDAQLSVRDQGGTLTTANPPATRVNDLVAGGLGASVSYAVPSTGTYYLVVDGTGAGTWASGGYSDYGSVGAYTLTPTGCTAGAGEEPVAPSAPQGLVATADHTTRELTLTWQPPASDGGSAVTGYRVAVDGGTPIDLGTTTTYTTGPLARGEHTFTVRAVNAVGTSSSAAGVAQVKALPGAPTVVTLATRSGAATASWAPPSDAATAAPISGYRVTLLQGGLSAGTVDLGPGARSHDFAGLPAATTYTATVVTLVGTETGEPATSSEATTPAAAPGAPTGVAAKPGPAGGKRTAKVAWVAPAATSGSPVTSYVVRAKRSGGGSTKTVSAPPSARSLTLSLGKGRWTFRVRAVSAAGSSPWSASSAAVKAR